jgi:hypothetical protein
VQVSETEYVVCVFSPISLSAWTDRPGQLPMALGSLGLILVTELPASQSGGQTYLV